jgi:hypothetical protein
MLHAWSASRILDRLRAVDRGRHQADARPRSWMWHATMPLSR